MNLNFTSPFYLGLEHTSSNIDSWASLLPTNSAEYGSAYSSVENQLARLQGCEASALACSTLHAFIGLFGILGRMPIQIYADEAAYPIVRWGIDCAQSLGAQSIRFRHNDPCDLETKMTTRKGKGRPVVVADSVCAGCGELAPIREYLSSVRKHDGLLILDDTQGLGILGQTPGKTHPYGLGGGGILPWSGVRGEDIIVISSLGKALGVPIAAVSSVEEKVRLYKAQSETNRYCSPPSIPIVRAAEHALGLNELKGDSIRVKLCEIVRYFREKWGAVGILSSGGLFPVQSLREETDRCERTRERLVSAGIAVERFSVGSHESRLVFLLTSSHTLRDIDRLLEVFLQVPQENRFLTDACGN